MIDDGRRSAIEISNQRLGRVDAQMVVERGQKIAGIANAFDGIFAAIVGSSDKAASFDTAASPDV